MNELLKKIGTWVMLVGFVGTLTMSCASSRGGKKTNDRPGKTDNTEATIQDHQDKL